MRSLWLAVPTNDHLAAMVALDQQCLGGLWSLEGYRREIESPNSILRLLQTDAVSPDSESGLVGMGCCWAILDEAHITVLAIAPAYQRQGLGQYLLLALLQAAQQRQLKQATLEVRATNAAALGLYHAFNFQTLGRRRRYYQDGEDALILWNKNLQAAEFKQALIIWQQQNLHRLKCHGWYPNFQIGDTEPRPQTKPTS